MGSQRPKIGGNCIKNLHLDKIKIDKKSCKSILIYYTAYVSPKSSKPLLLFISKTKGYIKEINGNKYLTLVLTDQNRQSEKIWKTMEKKN